VAFFWVTADEVYGQVRYLRVWLEAQDAAYVLAAKCDEDVVRPAHGAGRADRLIAALPARAWRRLSVGAGARTARLGLGPVPIPDRLATRTRALAVNSRAVAARVPVLAPTPRRPRRRVICRNPAVVSVIRCALIMDVAAGRAYYPALQMIASVRVPRLRADV